MIRFTKPQFITMGALIGLGLLNPFTVAVLDDWFKLVYTIVFVGCAGWVSIYVLYKAFKLEQTKIPAKTAKTKQQKYV